MIIIDLTYTVPLDFVEKHLEDHRRFLHTYYQNGTFIASGRKEPRTGGIILAHGSPEEIEQIIENDPFKKNQIAQYTFTQFIPTMASEDFTSLIEE